MEFQLSEERKHKEQLLAGQDQLKSELALIKKELADHKEGDDNRWLEKKAAFLSSPEFYELLASRPSKY